MKRAMILVLALMSNSVWAKGEDLESCLYSDGSYMEQRICDIYRKEKSQDDAKKQQLADWHSGANLETCHWNTGTVIEQNYCESMKKEKAEKDAKKQEEDERAAQLKREYDLEKAEANKRHEAFRREQEREEADQKRNCGKDYMTLRIGMKIERLEECYGAIYLTETTSKSGVTKTYRTMFDMVDVKNGKVVSYTKRRY